ncbi:hypothetical protein JCM9534A_65430 [Catenuloplanes indicus JCM 9534]
MLVAAPATAGDTGAPAGTGAAASNETATARRTGDRVEVLGARTETGQTFANPDGSFTTELFATPQRVRKDGGWVPIDTTLHMRPDGAVTPVAVPVDLRLSGGGDGPLVTLAAEGGRIGLAWPAPLPVPRLAGDTATYPDVLPGVDLQVTATVAGYREVLVVKTREAAAQPALRELRFGMVTDGVEAELTGDGALIARDADGAALFTADAPMMWDTPAPPGPAARQHQARSGESPAPQRHSPMSARLSGGELTVVPDRDILTDPLARLPIYIDPAAETVWSNDWTHINKTYPSQSYWSYDRTNGAKVGYSNWESPIVTYRSFFLFGFGGWQGRVITGATFQAELDHSASCSFTPTDLYRTADINRSQSITWNSSSGGGTWHTWLAQATGRANASCGQGNALMEWGNVAGVVQGAADAGGQLTLGLRAPNEGDANQWKKFVTGGARLAVNWNAPPRVPESTSTVPPTGCGTQANPTPLNTAVPTFTTRISDPHNDNVYGRLEVREGTTVVHSSDTPSVTSGSVVAWPPVPAGKLPTDQPARVFSYAARADDGHLASAWTTACYFTVDTVTPGTPQIESDDFPDGEPNLPVGQVGTLRIAPGFGPQGTVDTDLSGYRYGFQQDKMTGWVAADGAGRAAIPMVLWTTARTLYVQAVDRAGNPSTHDTPCICTAWDLRAQAGTATPADTPGDVNGDGLADISTTLDLGYGRTAAWSLLSKSGGGLYPQPYLGWDTGINGGFDAYRIKQVRGDFTGDGLADIALFRDDPNNTLKLFLLRSDSHRYDAAGTPLWESAPGSVWKLTNIQPVATDADGDGRLDLVTMLRLGPAEFSLNVLRNTGSGTTVSIAAPAEWYRNPVGYAEPGRMKVVGGDFNGDGKGEVAFFYNYDNSTYGLTRLWMHSSTGAAFSSATQVWDSGAGNWEWGRGTPVAADFTGDGRTDIIQMYDYGAATRFFIFPAAATFLGVGAPTVWWDGAPAGTAFAAPKAELVPGDLNGDGRADLAALYEATGAAKVHLFISGTGGTSAVPPDLGTPAWTGSIGAVTGSVTPEPGRWYQVVASHSGKCLDVSNVGTTSGSKIHQWTCTATAGNQRVTFVPAGGGPYYEVRFENSGRCLDVDSYGRGDGSLLQIWDCLGTGNQQFRLEYLGGAGADVQVRLRAAHSDKCVGISGASLADGGVGVQWTCSGGPGTDHAYHVRLLP